MPYEVTIREVRDEDAEALVILLSQLGYTQDISFVIQKLKSFDEYPTANIFVAEQNGNVLGFLSFDSELAFHRDGRIGTITAMCVSDGHRGRGIGKSLVNAAEQFAISSGCVRIAVASGLQRTETHKFYLALGYEEKTKRFTKEL